MRDELEEYFGGINELRMGASVELPVRPAELTLYQQCKSANLPLIAGGLLDQPHMWLDIVELIESIQKLYTIEGQGSSNRKQKEPVGFADSLSGASKRFQ